MKCLPETYEEALVQLELEQKARADEMPTEQDALKVIARGYQRLKDLGFSDAIYCPKDGTTFQAVEPGCTGIQENCFYQGEWPDGRWLSFNSSDVWTSRPMLFRAKGK